MAKFLTVNIKPEHESSGRNDEKRTNLIVSTVSTYSPSGREAGVSKIIRDYLRDRNLPARIDSAGNVICEFGTGAMSVLLCGHMDTVPGELPVKLEAGKIYGRGACDAKGPLLSLVFAFENLANQLSKDFNGRVIFAGVTQEELSSAGLTEVIQENIRADYSFFGEPGGFSKITVGYRGHLTLRVTITTPEIHASAPSLVTNSAELMFEFYVELKKILGAESNASSLEKFSVSLTEIRSGTAHNVIPGITVATIDIRIPLGSKSDRAKETVQNLVSIFETKTPDAKVETTYDEPTEPYRVPLNSPLVRALSRSILKKGSKPQFITKSGTGDMNTYAQVFGVDAVTYGPGEAKLSHSSEEYVAVNEIISCAEVISGAVKELFNANDGKSIGIKSVKGVG